MVVPGATAYITITITVHRPAFLFFWAVIITTSYVAISKPFIQSSCTIRAFRNISIKLNHPVCFSYRYIDIVLVRIDIVSVFFYVFYFSLNSVNIYSDCTKGNLSVICQLLHTAPFVNYTFCQICAYASAIPRSYLFAKVIIRIFSNSCKVSRHSIISA